MAENFYQSLKTSLSEESLPVLINLNLDDNLFIGTSDQINGYADFSCCFWGTPEFELAKQNFLKFSETPAISAYNKQLQKNIEVKARFYLYYVSFLWEESLLHYCQSATTIQAQKYKNMALTLIKNALN